MDDRRNERIAAAFAGWKPPQEITVTLLYQDGGLEELWTAESPVAPDGAAAGGRWFLAVGPAGEPIRPVAQTFIEGLPDGANIVVVTGLDETGRNVFRRINHQLN